MTTSGAGAERYERITIVGGGLAGLTAAIACAEQGAPVRLLEAHGRLGGRARTDDGPYRANVGPHALYKDGPLWAWLHERQLLPKCASPSLAGIRVRWQGEVRRMPPLALLPGVLRLRGRSGPVDRDFRSWAASQAGDSVAAMLSSAAGVYTFHHDPGELSAAFVWNHSVRVLLKPPPAARYPIGGWGVLVDILHARARQLGVEIELSSTVSVVPEPPVIIATELGQAGALLGEELAWPSGNTVCLDLAVRADRGDPFVVADLDEAGWMERFTASDPTLAPDGEQLIQAQMPIRPAESVEQASARLERLLDSSLSAWRERVTWRRRQIMDGRSGALDMPGTNWRERPSIDRGDGVFLAGDMVAAPGLLSEVSWASATQAAALALQAATIKAPRLRQVA